jgi:hypothetical protein
MERYKKYEPDQTQLLLVNPEVLFPRGSFERFLIDIINQIDFNNDEDGEDKGGETPYNPKSLLVV